MPPTDHPAATAPKRRIVSIQYLRGFAALLVVATHILKKLSQCGYAGYDDVNFNGAFGVDLFFVISGFVMCLTTSRAAHGKLSTVVGFLKRRFLRIFPMYWALTLVAFGIYLVAPSQVNMAGGETRVIESFLLLPTEGKYLVKNGWTLTYELYFYLIFGACLLLGRRSSRLVLVALIALPVLISGALPFSGAAAALITHSLTLEFLFGVALYALLQRLPAGGRASSPWVGALAIAGAVAFLFLNRFAYTDGDRFLTLGIPAFCICGGFLLMEPVFAARPNRVCRAIGDSSYSLYLIHPFVLAAVRGLVQKFDHLAGWSAPLVIALMLAGSALAGYASYVLFEDTADKFFKRRPRKDFLLWQYFAASRLALRRGFNRRRQISPSPQRVTRS